MGQSPLQRRNDNVKTDDEEPISPVRQAFSDPATIVGNNEKSSMVSSFDDLVREKNGIITINNESAETGIV